MLFYRSGKQEGFNPLLPVVKSLGARVWLFRESKFNRARAIVNFVLQLAFFYLLLLFLFSYEAWSVEQLNFRLIYISSIIVAWSILQIVFSVTARRRFPVGNDLEVVGCKNYIYLLEWLANFATLSFLCFLIAAVSTTSVLTVLFTGLSWLLMILAFVPLITVSRHQLTRKWGQSPF